MILPHLEIFFTQKLNTVHRPMASQKNLATLVDWGA